MKKDHEDARAFLEAHVSQAVVDDYDEDKKRLEAVFRDEEEDPDGTTSTSSIITLTLLVLLDLD